MCDLVLGSQSHNALGWLKNHLIKEFNMKDLGEAKTIIGWEITRDHKAGTLKIHQNGYIRDLIDSEGMTPCHPTVLPMKVGSFFSMDQAGDHLQANPVAYQRLVGRLIYLACGTRPDIAFVVLEFRCHAQL